MFELIEDVERVLGTLFWLGFGYLMGGSFATIVGIDRAGDLRRFGIVGAAIAGVLTWAIYKRGLRTNGTQSFRRTVGLLLLGTFRKLGVRNDRLKPSAAKRALRLRAHSTVKAQDLVKLDQEQRTGRS
jgi:hypothetical protein